MKKVLAVLLAAIMTFSLCSCMYLSADTIIHDSGTGSLSLRSGILKSLYDSIGLDATGATTFEANGQTYFGETQTISFSSFEEANQVLNAAFSESNGIEDYSGITLASDGSDLTLSILEGVDTAAFYRALLESQSDISTMSTSNSEMDALLNQETLFSSLVLELKLTFDRPIYQISGPKAGVTINNNSLTVDLTKVRAAIKFSTAASTASHSTFTDVSPDAWYYDAVTAMADAGLVNGVGNGVFAPDRPISRAEILQVIARAKGMETGTADGHWAGKAIRACVDAGYIVPGSITRGGSIVYAGNGEAVQLPGAWRYKLGADVQATREEAIGILFRASKDSLSPDGEALTKEVYSDVFQDLTKQLLPDYAEFNRGEDGYANENILAFMTGMVNGTDNQRHMKPTATISRAEFCQIIYNLGWAQ